MAATQADLVKRVLLHLDVLVGGETPSTEDDATVDLAIGEVMGELTELGLAYWAVGAIPEAVMRGMTIMVASNCAASFMSRSEAASYEQDRGRGERMIRRVVSAGSDHDSAPQHFF
jgi:hypothetical protein